MLMATVTTMIALATPGHGCFAIDNTTNTAAWTTGGTTTITHYTDYGDNLGYGAPIPKVLWPLTRAAERAMRKGDTGRKVRTTCRKLRR